MTRRPIGDLMLVDCAASPFLGPARQPGDRRPAADAAHENVLGFQFVCKGVELVREGDRQLALRPGDMVLWDGLQPTEIEIAEAFYKRTLLFPRDRVLAVCPRLAGLEALPSLAGQRQRAAARALHERAGGRDARRSTARPARRRPTRRSSCCARRSSRRCRAIAPPRGPPCAPRSRRYVRSHLQDPQLGPASIARAYAMSVRTLHALFEDVDASVAGLVRTRAAGPLPGGPPAAQRRLGHRDRLPLGLLRRRPLLPRVQARVRGHALRDPPRSARRGVEPAQRRAAPAAAEVLASLS